MTTASKLSSNGQTTIPPAVRAALDLRKGDEIAYVIKENLIILTKASAGPVHDPFVTESEADHEAYPNLESGCSYPYPGKAARPDRAPKRQLAARRSTRKIAAEPGGITAA
jgi:antitoxin PrlF